MVGCIFLAGAWLRSSSVRRRAFFFWRFQALVADSHIDYYYFLFSPLECLFSFARFVSPYTVSSAMYVFIAAISVIRV